MFPYFWFGLFIPVGVVLITVYMIRTHSLPESQVRMWVVSMCGLLLMDLGAVLVHDLGGLMYIILPIGFLLLVFGFWQLRQHKQLR